MEDKPKDECGVVGIYAPGRSDNELSAVYEAARALLTLQHRGQQSAGVGGRISGKMAVTGDLGKVEQALRGGSVLSGLDRTDFAMAHVRYATSLLVQGRTQAEIDGINRWAIQPMSRSPLPDASFMLGLNGNCVNTAELLAKLKEEKPILGRGDLVTDTAIMTSLISQRVASGLSIREALLSVTSEVTGAYSMVVWGQDREGEKLYALRDPNGFRPLMLGALPNNGWMVASEEGALNIAGAEFDREIPAGHMVEISADGLNIFPAFAEINPSYCIFEGVYLARPDQRINNVRVRQMRIRSGEKLAAEYPVDADVVIGVPDSGDDAAKGYARQSGIPKEDAFIRNRYNMDRSFIEDSQISRVDKIRLKISSIISEYVAGKRVVIVDDSLVRSNTIRILVDMVRRAGAEEAHVRIASDSIKHRCLYGVDMPDESELIAAHKSVDEITQIIKADSLAYLSIEGLRESTGAVDRQNRALGAAAFKFCDACMTGNYPTPVLKPLSQVSIARG